MRFSVFVLLIYAVYCPIIKAQTNTFPSSGNVGIGTLSPNSLLEIFTNDTRQTSILGRGNDGNFRLVSRQDRASNAVGALVGEIGLDYGTTRNTAIRFHRGGSVTGGFLSFTTDSNIERMRILGNGDIGIGTPNPSNAQGWHRVVEIFGDHHSKLLVSSQSQSVKMGMFAHSNWGDGPKGIIGTETNHDLSIQSGYNQEKIRIKVNGNVGIGLSNPTHKLEVNGTIRSKEIKVEATNWPDYVFSPDYELMDLDSVAGFIRAHHHLPGIPSEKEVTESGVALGEMNALLLGKIEELTLHLIIQKQLLEEQSKLLQVLESKIK